MSWQAKSPLVIVQVTGVPPEVAGQTSLTHTLKVSVSPAGGGLSTRIARFSRFPAGSGVLSEASEFVSETEHELLGPR
jgi:hypothetical protein